MPHPAADLVASPKVRTFLRPFIPHMVRHLRQRVMERCALRRAMAICEGLSVKETFESIYKHNLWGGQAGEFYSGGGSDAAVAEEYCAYVRQFVRDRNVRSLVDLGCGDFRVGKQLLVPGTSYVGIDVVPSLIERNNREFGGGAISFQVVDAITQRPPAADLCLVRQVLQHLSNDQVSDILDNCRSFRYLLVSEHLFLNGKYPVNMDKPHGFDTRPSGIRLDQAPFYCKTVTVLESPLGRDEVIRTVLLDQRSSQGLNTEVDLL